jgi:hypothetical protein
VPRSEQARRVPHPAPAKTPRELAERVRAAYRRHVDYPREVATRALVAFLAMFVFLRALTFAIRAQLVPIQNVVTGSGLHIHHFVWGIFLLLLVGFLALVLDQARWHPWLAIPFGFAAALVLDEFALWLNLADVYWAKQGRQSLDAIVIAAALLILFYVAHRFWREAAAEVAHFIRGAFRRTAGPSR